MAVLTVVVSPREISFLLSLNDNIHPEDHWPSQIIFPFILFLHLLKGELTGTIDR